MTDVGALPRTAESAARVVTEFFARYRAHDVEAMTSLCSVSAGSPTCRSSCAARAVLRGDGTVGTVGVPLWTGLIASFPDLSNSVRSIASNDDGDVVAEVNVEGLGGLAWGLISPAGRHYCEPHLFIFQVGPDLLIDAVTAYWKTPHQPAARPRRSRLIEGFARIALLSARVAGLRPWRGLSPTATSTTTPYRNGTAAREKCPVRPGRRGKRATRSASNTS